MNTVEPSPEVEPEEIPEFDGVFLAEEDDGDHGDEQDPIEEQDAIDVLLTWKQARQGITHRAG